MLTAAANSAETLDSKFWPELFRYYHFERWKIRTDFEYEIQFGDGIGPMMRKKPGLDIPTGKLARTMITALLFDDHEFLDWAGPLLTHHFWRRSDVKLNNSAGPVSGFGLRLWAISKGWDSDIIGCSQSTKIRAKDGKLHHDVIDSWDDDKKFRQAMPALVKYLHDVSAR